VAEPEPPETGNGTIRAGAVMAKFSWGIVSDPGPFRDHNEDFVAARVLTTPDDSWDRGPVLALADGMGGHAAGEVASRLAIDALLATYAEASPGTPQQLLKSAARAANLAVVDASLEPGRRGMGTTLLAIALGGTEAAVAHVGDSRAYLVRGETCTQLTNDHSRVGEMLRMHMITAEQAANHPARSQLTRSIGGDPFVQVDMARQPVQQHDTLVLCSDGLWDVVARPEIAEVGERLTDTSIPTAVEAADRLVRLAVDRGSTDNVSAVVVHLTSDQPIPPAGGRRFRLRRARS
jgi:serine/threonine protein phosphatase PrpC